MSHALRSSLVFASLLALSSGPACGESSDGNGPTTDDGAGETNAASSTAPADADADADVDDDGGPGDDGDSASSQDGGNADDDAADDGPNEGDDGGSDDAADSTSADGGADTGPVGTWDGIDCGTEICEVPGQFCCAGLNDSSCDATENSASCTFPSGAPAYCDGPEDCPGGEFGSCCASAPAGTFCKGECEPGPITFGGAGEAELCHDDTQCPEGLTCVECFPPMGPSFNMCTTTCEDRGLSSSGG